MLNSLEVFSVAMTQHVVEIMADIPDYTDLQPLIQISEIKVG